MKGEVSNGCVMKANAKPEYENRQSNTVKLILRGAKSNESLSS